MKPNIKPKSKHSPVINFSLAPIKNHQSPISLRKLPSVLTSTIQLPKLSRSSETSKKMTRRPIIFSSFLSQTLRRKTLLSLKSFLFMLPSRHLQGKGRTVLSPATDSPSTTPTNNHSETILLERTTSKTNPSKGSNQATLQYSSTTTPKGNAAPPSTDSNP